MIYFWNFNGRDVEMAKAHCRYYKLHGNWNMVLYELDYAAIYFW